ncbi:MAG: methylmalonyl Co-A mutase-associated GTPase MeaB [Polyangiaceae bacterium]|nr:methylmalonyl Co-A mutase-associated GTPase MeaB [Polyangiaceae bacterium]
MSAPGDPEALAAAALRRAPAGIARAISLVEDRRPEARPAVWRLLRRLAAEGRGASCHRVGLTGPPGVGKSTLASAMVGELRRRGRVVGVLAVDPSSPRSGGALLGDRARIALDPGDDAVFVRSMAAGGDLGGLSRAAGSAVEVLSAVHDVVLVETTGVGQSETDVEHVTDTVIVAIQPASGDVLQFLKAGLLEVPDVLVVNKADLGAPAERALAELRSALGTLDAGAGRAGSPPVLATSGATARGVPELVDACDQRFAALVADGSLLARRRRASAAWAYGLLRTLWGERGVERAGGRAALVGRLEAAIDRGAPAVEAVYAEGSRLE